MINPYAQHTVFCLWSDYQIIHLTYSMKQMIEDAKRLNLKGFMEETSKPLYAIELLLKDIAERRMDIN